MIIYLVISYVYKSIPLVKSNTLIYGHASNLMTPQGKIEKYIMRKAFDTPEDPYLPQHILYRQKEQFSDGVGYNWIDELRGKAEQEVGHRLAFLAMSCQSFDISTVQYIEIWRLGELDTMYSYIVSKFRLIRHIFATSNQCCYESIHAIYSPGILQQCCYEYTVNQSGTI